MVHPIHLALLLVVDFSNLLCRLGCQLLSVVGHRFLFLLTPSLPSPSIYLVVVVVIVVLYLSISVLNSIWFSLIWPIFLFDLIWFNFFRSLIDCRDQSSTSMFHTHLDGIVFSHHSAAVDCLRIKTIKKTQWVWSTTEDVPIIGYSGNEKQYSPYSSVFFLAIHLETAPGNRNSSCLVQLKDPILDFSFIEGPYLSLSLVFSYTCPLSLFSLSLLR